MNTITRIGEHGCDLIADTTAMTGKWFAIQIIEGPLGTRPGTNRINPISGTSTIGIQILKGCHLSVLAGCVWS